MMPATTPKPKERPAAIEREAPKYVRCELSAEQKRNVASWAADLEDMDLYEWVSNRVSGGHTLTLRCNDVGFQCSLTGVREASGHSGLCLISRASTPIKALQVAMYKDTLVLDGLWPVAGALDDLEF